MTALQDQDRRFSDAGFSTDGDYEHFSLSGEEREILDQFVGYIVDHAETKIANKFSRGMTDCKFLRYYAHVRLDDIRDAFATEIDKDLSEFYYKLRKNSDYIDHKDGTIEQGAETDEGLSYEADGDTIKPNSVRFYYKFPIYYRR
jgi:hypothetical protein